MELTLDLDDESLTAVLEDIIQEICFKSSVLAESLLFIFIEEDVKSSFLKAFTFVFEFCESFIRMNDEVGRFGEC